MKQCGVLRDKELFDGSDIVRRYTYKTGNAGDNYALLGETDCFVCCSPYDGIAKSTIIL